MIIDIRIISQTLDLRKLVIARSFRRSSKSEGGCDEAIHGAATRKGDGLLRRKSSSQ
jgi:hypothetical protein